LNALCDQLMTELNTVLDQFEADATVRAYILTGSGKAFAGM
jgi:enoyl-CoA hydratase